MAKWCFPNLTDSYAAIVSCHGYFEIQRRETYNSYASGIGPVYNHKTKERMPDPVVVYAGGVEDLGITYLPEYDDIDLDDVDAIECRLMAYLAEKEPSRG